MEKFKKEGRDKFSLLKDGTLDKPKCARLLLVNVSLESFRPEHSLDPADNHG